MLTTTLVFSDYVIQDLVSRISSGKRIKRDEQYGNREEVTHIDVRFGTVVGQIGPKFGQIGDFSDQIPVHIDTAIQNVLKSDLKKSRIFPIWSQSDTLRA